MTHPILRAAVAVLSLAGPVLTGSASAGPAEDIAALVARMQAAVLARDEAGYLALVDPTDPVFALEHARWAKDWAGRGVRRLELAVSGLEVGGAEATAELEWRWEGADGGGTAALPVVFRSTPGGWRYGGERWVSFRAGGLVVSAPPGLEAAARATLETLPEVRAHVAQALGHAVPETRVKLYASSAALTVSVALNLPLIGGWNEPGEAIKLVAPASPSRSGLAHELTHNAVFDRFGDGQARIPWWVHEGIAELVASRYWGPERAAQTLARVAGWAREGALPAWEAITDFGATPASLWRFVYPQGYAMLRYLTETYGPERRERWLAALAAGRSPADAASLAYSRPPEALDREWRAWLAAFAR